MNIYFNAEYTGTNRHAQLISLGLVAESGQKLYLEFLDVDQYIMTPQLKSAVLVETFLYEPKEDIANDISSRIKYAETFQEEYGFTYAVVTRSSAGTFIKEWMETVIKEYGKDDEVLQLVSYASHYDASLFFNLWSGVNLPEFLNPTCYDILQDIQYLQGNDCDPLSKRMRQSLQEFTQFVESEFNVKLKGMPKQNALCYAQFIGEVYSKIHQEQPF